jgi:hypothetical protein
MKIKAALPVIISLILTACTQHTPSDKTPFVGEAVDSVAIANDTVQQENIEGSYEYAQTIIVSPKLVYDVRGYGGPASYGEYCILRRGADNKPDTVAHGERSGIIVNAFAADLNSNLKEEIYLIMRKTNPGASCHIVGYEFDNTGRATSIEFSSTLKGFSINSPLGKDSLSDTIFVQGDVLVKSSLPYREGNSCYKFNLQGTISRLVGMVVKKV